MNYDWVGEFLFKLVVGGGGLGAIVYAIVRFLGKTLVEKRVAIELAEFRHKGDAEIARMKIEVDSALGGTLKLQDADFKVLPKTWKILDDAYGNTLWATNRTQEYPDVGSMDEAELEDFLTTADLRPSQKQRLRDAIRRERQTLYIEQTYWSHIRKAKKSIVKFDYCINHNAIFYGADLKQKLSRLLQLMWNATISSETGHAYQLPEHEYAGFDELRGEGAQLKTEVEAIIRDRLLSHSSRSATVRS